MTADSHPRTARPAVPEQASGRLEEFEELYQHAPIGLCAVDRNLRYLRANEAYAQIVGRTVEDLIGRGMWEVVPESAREGAMSAAKKVIETGQPVLGTELWRRVPEDLDRERIWHVDIHPMRHAGEVIGAMAVLQDVTSVRRAEEQARARLEELESIYRNSPVGLSFVDCDLRYLRVNQTLADMNGCSIEEVVGKSYRDLSPETADASEPFLRKLMERGEPVRNLEVFARPPADPEVEHAYLLSMDMVRSAQGEVIGHVAAVQDVTELRRAEETAARRLEELEILYAHTPVGLCYLDAELRVVHNNPLFAQLSSRPPAQQVGVRVEELLPEELGRQLLPQLRYVTRSGTSSVGLEVRGRLPASGSEERTWLAHTHPARSSAGGVTGVITVLQDITPLAKQRREIETVRDRLVEAQNVARLGSWVWNLIEDEVWWSRELFEIFGESPTYAPSYEGFFDHVLPADRAKVREQIEQTLADAESRWTTFRIVRPDTSERLLFSAARLERTADGLPKRLVGTCQDVTEFGPLGKGG